MRADPLPNHLVTCPKRPNDVTLPRSEGQATGLCRNMKRRSFFFAVCCASGVLSMTANAQQSMTYRIGYLHPTDSSVVLYLSFLGALKDLGYVVGSNTTIEA